MAIIAVPSVLKAMDNSIDISCFYGENEEEEKEGLKLLFEIKSQNSEDFFTNISSLDDVVYTFKAYQKPHLNIVFPPPEMILLF